MTQTLTATLFSPLTIRGVAMRNRIGISPMCQYGSVDGFATDWHLVHLGSRAVGGAGLVMTEAAAVEPRGKISPDDLGIWSADHVPMLKKIAEFIKAHGAVAGMQLAHSGRKGSTVNPWSSGSRSDRKNVPDAEGGFDIVAPSAIPFSDESRMPRELTVDEIHQIRAKFVDATMRCLQAGFQFVELHAAHGYLLNSFYSPLSNHRTDAYGGSFENRTRFVVETAAAVRKAWPEHLPMAVRISASDWVEGGWTIEDSVKLANLLKAVGVDVIDASSGFVVPHVRYPQGPGWQVSLASQIKRESGLLTAAVGMITEATQANEIIRSNDADIVMLARQSIRDPYWPYHAAKELGVEGQTLSPRYTYAI